MNVNTVELTPEEAKAILADGRLILAAREEVEQGQAAIAELRTLRAENERLRGEVAAAKEDGFFGRMAGKLATEKQAAESTVAVLRRALEGVDELSMVHSPQMSGRVSLRMMHAGMSEALHAVKAALARTPAQSLARVKAEALREAAKIIDRSRANTPYAFGGYSAADAERALLMEADRLEKEAANGR